MIGHDEHADLVTVGARAPLRTVQGGVAFVDGEMQRESEPGLGQKAALIEEPSGRL